jgi:peptidoglycan/LPS O-acetylase OafA/YrhL
MTSGPTSRRNTAILSFVADLILVAVFVVIGRVSHKEALTAVGVLTTFWPFAAGLVLAWIVTRNWRTPTRVVWSGISVWVLTVIFGMIFRLIGAQDVAISFAIVALIVLGVFLLGWRAIVRLSTRGRRTRLGSR